MTWVSIKNCAFFEEFCKGNIDRYGDTIEQYELVFSDDFLRLETPANILSRIWYSNINRSSVQNAERINTLARDKLEQISGSLVYDQKRLEETCIAASRTCYAIAERVSAQHKELYDSLEDHGLQFLEKQAEISNTPIIKVACENRIYQAALQLIIKKSSVEDAREHADKLLPLAFDAKQYPLCRSLLALGAKPTEAIAKETTLLFDAIEDNQEAVAIELVEAGAPLQKPRGGRFPLHLAAAKGFCALAKVLIERGADPSRVDTNGNTALHEACRYYHVDVAKLLLEKHVDVSKCTKAKGLPAFLLPAEEPRLAVDFYVAMLAAYNIPKAALERDGIEAFLTQCRNHADDLIHRQENPFELALLFQDRALAQVVSKKLTSSEFFEAVKRLKLDYPTSSIGLIEFCYLRLSDQHLQQQIDAFRVTAPAREVSLDILVDYATTAEARGHLQACIARIVGKSPMQGLLSDNEAMERFYNLLSYCLKNCIIMLEEAPQAKMLVVETICELEKHEQHTAGRYFGMLTKLYRKIAAKRVVNFEKKIEIMLAEHREELLLRCLDPLKINNYDEYNYVLSRIGPEFGLLGQEYNPTAGQCDLDAVRGRFWQLYTPESIIKNCIEPALEQNSELKREFENWLLAKMPPSWGSAPLANFTALTEDADVTDEKLREFLHKNGIPLQDGAQNYEEAIEATRRQEYLKREVYYEGKIKPQAIGRMLAGLEAPALISERLEHEYAPTTFAHNWLNKIRDLV